MHGLLFLQSTIENVEMGESSASFESLDTGDYLVCSYNESQDCPPSPSPLVADLDDIYTTGSIQDGCFAIECMEITVPETLTPNLENTGMVDVDNSTGNNVYVLEVCGGTLPYNTDFTSSGGFASVSDLPSENVGCINYQIIYANAVDWTLTITDAHDCSNNSVVFSSDDLPSNPLQITAVTITPETCAGDEDGAIEIEVEGGDDSCDDYTYTWSGPNGFSETTTDEVTGSIEDGLGAGTYSVTVTDCSGATTVDSNIFVSRANSMGRGGRGRGRGGCKTGGDETIIPISGELKAYPNPFAEQTLIEFSLPTDSKVWLSVYSIEGRKVAKLLEGDRMEGNTLQRFDFNASGLQSGLYILELQTELGIRQHQQLVVVK